jgi:hypothetical protein
MPEAKPSTGPAGPLAGTTVAAALGVRIPVRRDPLGRSRRRVAPAGLRGFVERMSARWPERSRISWRAGSCHTGRR